MTTENGGEAEAKTFSVSITMRDGGATDQGPISGTEEDFHGRRI